uniref:Uncharacterized protein n=1 Tax=Anguilla anguilla TaxID=7936 RepID=A0A0E9SSS9_ANGAN
MDELYSFSFLSMGSILRSPSSQVMKPFCLATSFPFDG